MTFSDGSFVRHSYRRKDLKCVVRRRRRRRRHRRRRCPSSYLFSSHVSTLTLFLTLDSYHVIIQTYFLMITT
jgi:hypothetical protein